MHSALFTFKNLPFILISAIPVAVFSKAPLNFSSLSCNAFHICLRSCIRPRWVESVVIAFRRALSGFIDFSAKNSSTATIFLSTITGNAKPNLTLMSFADFVLRKYDSRVTSSIHSGFPVSETFPISPTPG